MNEWLLRRSRRPEATFRLFCFPYAGGSVSEFLRWETQLKDCEVWGVLPPGRGARFEEPPYTSAARLTADLVTAVRFDPPFLLFGHSLGALLAFETARALQARGRPAPLAVVVSGHRPPHLPLADPPIHALSDAEFRAEVARRHPAPPPELAGDPEFLAASHRLLRSDLEVFETYRHLPGPPLTCPLVVIGGREGRWRAEDLAPWEQHTAAGCRIEMVGGDHHHLPGQPDELLAIISELGFGLDWWRW